jgi:anti-anti-sigma regulatory factor
MPTTIVIVDCSPVRRADLSAIQWISRRALDARRRGSESRLLHASRELLQLIAFAGLDGVLIAAAGFPPRY